jgi:hypothetical protein
MLTEMRLYRYSNYTLKPKPAEPLPEIFQGGSSRAARDMAGTARASSSVSRAITKALTPTFTLRPSAPALWRMSTTP